MLIKKKPHMSFYWRNKRSILDNSINRSSHISYPHNYCHVKIGEKRQVIRIYKILKDSTYFKSVYIALALHSNMIM